MVLQNWHTLLHFSQREAVEDTWLRRASHCARRGRLDGGRMHAARKPLRAAHKRRDQRRRMQAIVHRADGQCVLMKGAEAVAHGAPAFIQRAPAVGPHHGLCVSLSAHRRVCLSARGGGEAATSIAGAVGSHHALGIMWSSGSHHDSSTAYLDLDVMLSVFLKQQRGFVWQMVPTTIRPYIVFRFPPRIVNGLPRHGARCPWF